MEDTNNTWTKPGQNLDKTWTKRFVHPRGFGQDGFNLVKTTRFCPSGQNLPTLPYIE